MRWKGSSASPLRSGWTSRRARTRRRRRPAASDARVEGRAARARDSGRVWHPMVNRVPMPDEHRFHEKIELALEKRQGAGTASAVSLFLAAASSLGALV